MENLLIGNVKVGDTIKYGFKIVKVGRIHNGMPNSIITGYDQYGNWVKISFKTC